MSGPRISIIGSGPTRCWGPNESWLARAATRRVWPRAKACRGGRERRRTVKRSIRIAGHATSVSLEAEFWAALQETARRRGVTLSRLIAQIDSGRKGNLASALRLLVLEAYRSGELPAVRRG